MESVDQYYTQLLEIANRNPWIIHEDIVFREIDNNEAYNKGTFYIYGGYVLHIAEYVKIDGNTIRCLKYRYQLQDKDDILIFRWDNAPHHKNIPTHPFHKHCQNGTIVSSKEMNLFFVMEQLDEILSRSPDL
jgi:hypothetical protein